MKVYQSTLLFVLLHGVHGGEPGYYVNEDVERDLTVQQSGTELFSEGLFSNNGTDVNNSTLLEDAIHATEDYYADLPEFVTHDIDDPFQCKCVTCEEDEVCGGLWRGSKYENYEKADTDSKKIHIVISHCKSPLHWVDEFTMGYDVASIHVITKCGEVREKIKAPKSAKIIELPNVGRCDHTYAYYISHILPNMVKDGDEDTSIVVFLKDDISARSLHQSGNWNTFEELLRITSSDNGFACGISPDNAEFGQHQFLLSAYHEVETLFDFSMKNYQNGNDNTKFQPTSKYTNMGEWWKSLNLTVPNQLVQVCYGGVFAASVSNILMRDINMWKTMEKSLSRGNNIIERHYAERAWAALLATPLQPFQIDALLYKADGVYLNKNSMHGALMARPQLFLHIGVFGTYSTELLTEYVVKYKSLMKLDGYNIAVHGKSDDGIHGFPNIDRLASCMWSDMIKSMFPAHQKDATFCPDEMLPKLTDYMTSTQRRSQDLVMLNPWLVRPGTAESLGIFIDPIWDVTTVVYYRRYFEWITLMFGHWREEFLDGTSSEEIPYSTFRYIDFLREYNKRLFYGKNVNEDPVRDLHLNAYDDIMNVKNRRLKVYADQFDLSSNVDVQELTDLQEYTYFVAKQYNSVPRLRHVTIVNFHDIRDPVVNFFCHVLDHADNSCKAAIEMEGKVDDILDEPIEMDKEFVQASNTTVPFDLQTALEDIVIHANALGKLKMDAENFNVGKRRASQFQLWIDMVRTALEEKEITADDFPFQCLYEFENRRLLQVSLAYEKSMLPMFFASPKGETAMKEAFSHWRFCSVDTKDIIQGSEWKFLFANAEKYVLKDLPKAYVHIGAPKTGSTSLQDTMFKDRDTLKEDSYYLALHGQVRRGKFDDYVFDNVLVECDSLGACIWSDEEKEVVFQGSGDNNAGVCPEYLPIYFNKLMSMANDAEGNLVISNEWLNRPSSETGLVDLLKGFQPVIVIYYRRFFDWVISAHFQWHFDIGTPTFESLQGKIRLVDFLRLFCGRLFASDDDLELDALADLTDIQEYTYHSWKRYNAVPKYDDNIKIVNFHNGNIIKTFYCDVLKAEKSCELESERTETLKTRAKDSTAYFDLAVGTHWLRNNEDQNDKELFQKTAEKFKERMTSRGLVEDDLPKECLSKSEQQKLLRVSLAYEKILLPETYEAGEVETKEHFAKLSTKNRFCSVDLNIVNDPKWSFLFE